MISIDSLNESELFLNEDEVNEYQAQLNFMPHIVLDEVEQSDLGLLANGGYRPLTGFNNERDYWSIIRHNRLASGDVWTIPIVLAVKDEQLHRFHHGETIACVTSDRELLGILELEEIFQRDYHQEALAVYGTTDTHHPGVGYLRSKGKHLLSGRVKAVKSALSSQFPDYELTPRKTQDLFEKKGWKTIVAFQTRNPIHRAHEYLQKVALEMVDGLFIHPLVGATKPGDIPADIRMRCYETLIKNYFPAERVALGVFPAAMRYAGPKEAVFHALVRKNYGCTHFIVGRDHAGVGTYYGTYDAQRIFDEFSKEEIGITILKFENTFYCKRCGNMASSKTCPHTGEEQVFLSGTKVREMLADGKPLPPEFTRAEVSDILMGFYQNS